MEYIVLGIIVIIVIILGVVFFLETRKRITDNTPISTGIAMEKSEENSVPINNDLNELVIQMEMLPVEAIHDENQLVEITDSKVLARVNNLVPGLTQAENAVNNAVQAVQSNGEVLYRAIIPVGAKLTDSKAMEGAVRGIYHSADGIKGHANFLAAEAQKGTAVVANTAAAAMGVASMIVGQYYMSQINAELGKISDGILKIFDFQDNEYRSRVFSLVAHIKKISDFQIEILENDELRLSKISQLDSLEEECTKLLGQANMTLAGYTKGDYLDYTVYEKKLYEAQNWFVYQKTLLKILCKISELRYTLHLGAVSREQCISLLHTYQNQVVETQSRLTEWHNAVAQKLKIDVSGARRKRGGLDGAMHFIPGLLNEDYNFKAIEKKTAKMITTQSEGKHDIQNYDTSDLYSEDVQLISKGGKVYYLPTEKHHSDDVN